MAAVKKTGARNAPPIPQTFRILYKGGQEDYVGAHSFSYHPKQGDLIRFYDSDTNEAGDLLLRAPEVASVIAYSRMVEAPPLVELQSRFKNLEARMDALERNLVDVVMRAVNTAFAQQRS